MTEITSTQHRSDPITGFILAGGQSRRMGRDKASLQWRGRTLIDHMVQLLSTVTSPVRIVGREDLPDRLPGCGPLGGILTALEASKTSKNLVVGVDLPLLTTSFLEMLRARVAATAKPIVACRIGARFPLCLGIDKALLPIIGQRIAVGNLAIYRLVEETDAEVIDNADPAIFRNINTPEDWEKVRQG